MPAMQPVPHVAICEGCDAVFQKPVLGPGEVARCSRCGTVLERHTGNAQRHILPMALAALLMFAVANLFPIIAITLGGQYSETTLGGAVLALRHEGMAEVALLVLATTLLFPFMQLLILLYLLLPLQRRRRAPGFAWLLRTLQWLLPWGMVEVFLLGILVAIVKLSSSAQVIVGPALGAFVALTVLLTLVLTFQPRHFWHLAWDAP